MLTPRGLPPPPCWMRRYQLAQPDSDAAAEEVEEVEEDMPSLVGDEVEQPEQVAQTRVEAAQTLVADDDDFEAVLVK